MKNCFLSMLRDLKKDELKALLSMMNYFPEEQPVENIGGFRISLPQLKDLQKKKSYYASDVKKAELQVLLKQRIYAACKIPSNTSEDKAARMIVDRIAESTKTLTTPEMTIRDIENEILLTQTEDHFPLNVLAISAMTLMARVERNNLDSIQEQIISSLLDALILTRSQKEHLLSTTRSDISIETLRELVVAIKQDRRINRNRVFSAILGFTWSVALSDSNVTLKEIDLFNRLSEEFGIRENAALKIRATIERNYDEAARLTIEELNNKGAGLKPGTLDNATLGITGSIIVLGLAESAGFGLFLFSTTFLKAISLLIGVSFSFGTYTTLTTVLGVLTGPVGWIGIPAMIAGGVILKGGLDQSPWKPVRDILVRVAYLRGDI